MNALVTCYEALLLRSGIQWQRSAACAVTELAFYRVFQKHIHSGKQKERRRGPV